MSLSASELGPGDHVCALVPDDGSHIDVVASYFAGALARREQVLYIVDHSTAAEILERLRERGLPV
ncbi:MAG TPA: MEDS domain-containing protein, partial [Candidatus Thermoplasmatota archaeon]|nr:MEDS domain-containing protein [Candidatus Thermoplasmatota archaeon]